MGEPKDLMGPVSFLLSDAAGYVTGADIRVDGGYTVTSNAGVGRGSGIVHARGCNDMNGDGNAAWKANVQDDPGAGVMEYGRSSEE
ncbi:hypothetical protein E4U43_004548 [Claviceps pusilla]|uniref:Uncharacterized protein n=1 Tax=Claviceps pusilla TaxID=123648 RepID=A0A9P7N400_9HYPO|nr:hypothetical protein E4U43_004548 [Claviceps pusilla]